MNIPPIQLDEALKAFGTLAEKRKLKLVTQRTFLVTLLHQLEVEVSSTGGRTLKIALKNKNTSIVNSQEKYQLQSACVKNTAAAEFVQSLGAPGHYRYASPMPWRWASAGYLVILNIGGVRYCPLFLRELKQVPGWNVANGASETQVELPRPQLNAEREAKEELIIVNTATGLSYRLELDGGTQDLASHHRRVLKELNVSAAPDSEPLIGAMVPGQPDIVHVRVDWERRHGPFVSEYGFVLFNDEDGEMGVEFIQVVEWTIPAPLVNLRFYDGEIHEYVDLEDGKPIGKPLQRPIGLFRLDDLIEEFLKPEPMPRPAIVYDRSYVYQGEQLRDWLALHPDAQKWCPVTRKVLARYFHELLDISNSFLQKPSGVWSIGFVGETITLENNRGLEYIAQLIQHQGECVHCSELVSRFNAAAAGPDPHYGQMTIGELADQSLFVQGPEPRAETGLSHYKLRLEKIAIELGDLNAKLAEARRHNDSEEEAALQETIEKKQEEFDALAAELNELRAALKGHRGASLKTRTEHDRQSVSKAIGRSLKVIQKEHRKLWEHLHRYLSLGVLCTYAPPPHYRWRV